VQLYLIRHGIAAERGPAYPDDGARPLTEQGQGRIRAEARALRRVGPGIGHVVTSPLLRARQTAKLLAEGLDPRPPVVDCAALGPDGTPAEVRAALGAYGADAAVALVGHEPNLSELAAALTGGTVRLGFKKGAICRIDLDTLRPARPGALRWFIPPKLLRLLGSPR